MRVLFIGGTGVISTAVSRLAVERGIDLTLFNRGQRSDAVPPGAKVMVGDIRDPASRAALASRSFDVVVDWIAFTPEHVRADIALFSGRVGQYIFISSASAYQKPATQYLITESTPLANPYWEYSQNKIACEATLMEAYRTTGFPVTIVRPSHTYGETQIPAALNSWSRPWTLIDRMRRGQKIIVPGDGTSLWTLTHNSDFAKAFVGLLGHPQAIGHAFHITSDEVLTWNQIHEIVGRAAGVEPRLIHIATDFIVACAPHRRGELVGDKITSVVFDNTKVRRLVPDYHATVPFARGIEMSIRWYEKHPERQVVDVAFNEEMDRIIQAYERVTPEPVSSQS